MAEIGELALESQGKGLGMELPFGIDPGDTGGINFNFGEHRLGHQLPE